MPGVAAIGRDDDDDGAIEQPDQHQPNLAVIEPIILALDNGASEHLPRIGEIRPRLSRVASRFAGSNVMSMRVSVDAET